MTDFLPGLTLVLGGAACGKSAYAERLVFKTGLPRIYIATAQAFDAEMTAKIAEHQSARGPDWTTIEAPIDLPGAVSKANKTDVVLIDCATLWLTNLVLAEIDLAAQTTALKKSLADAPCPVVIVSNEVGQGIVPDNALSRRFRNAQGQLNQDLAQQADLVVTVMAGLPLALKGHLP